MKKVIVMGLLTAFFSGCGEDKKAVIPTKLDNELPKVATSGGGGGADPGGDANKGKAKGPGGGAVAD